MLTSFNCKDRKGLCILTVRVEGAIIDYRMFSSRRVLKEYVYEGYSYKGVGIFLPESNTTTLEVITDVSHVPKGIGAIVGAVRCLI